MRKTEVAERWGAAVKLGSETVRAFRFVMAKWKVYHWIPTFWECPHCAALVGSRAGAVRHRQREARIELALRELGLIEPNLDIRIFDNNRE